MPDVLVVDDHKELALLLSEMFNKNSISSSSASNGDEVVAKLSEWSSTGTDVPSVCILDVMMPGLAGVELMKAILEIVPEMRFLLITAYNEIPEIDQMSRQGAVEVFYKPFDVQELIAKANFVLSNKKRIPVA